MVKCHHKCRDCGTTWECSKHYISNGPLYSKRKKGYNICNNWCPKCHKEERKEFKMLLEELSEIGHFSIDKIKKNISLE